MMATNISGSAEVNIPNIVAGSTRLRFSKRFSLRCHNWMDQ